MPTQLDLVSRATYRPLGGVRTEVTLDSGTQFIIGVRGAIKTLYPELEDEPETDTASDILSAAGGG